MGSGTLELDGVAGRRPPFERPALPRADADADADSPRAVQGGKLRTPEREDVAG
jgi:hypothetical protein